MPDGCEGERRALAWSADATRLGFVSYRKRLYVMRADGKEAEPLFSEYRANDLSWSRQGRLAWTVGSFSDSGRIRVTNKARTTVRTLKIRASNVAWSPSGRRLAYVYGSTLATIAPDGRHRRRLTGRCTGPQTGFQFDSDVAWSPDGRQLLCSTSEDSLLAVNVRTGRVRTVVRGRVGDAITSFDWQRARRR